MADEPNASRPDPSSARTPSEFVAQLNSLRRWAGQPSLRVLQKLAGLRPQPGSPPTEALPTSTTHEILAGKRLPRLPRADFVEQFVAACLRAARCDDREIGPEVQRWRRSWQTLLEATPVNGQVINEPDLAHDRQQAATAGAQRLPRRRLTRRNLVQVALAVTLFGTGAGAGGAATHYLAEPQPAQCPQPSVTLPRGKERVVNGNFDRATEGWWHASGGYQVREEDGRMLIDVPGHSGRNRWDKLVEQRGISLRKGRTYTASFDMSADRPVSIYVAVQMEFDPFEPVLQHIVTVGPTPCHFTFTATNRNVDTDHGVVTFQLGGHTQDHAYILDNVSLIEHP